METWKTITGYEGRYQVSDLGRIRSLTRKVNNSHNGGYEVSGQILKPRSDKDGYLMTDFWKNGNKTTVKIHRLVAIAFIEGFDDTKVVDHINGVRNDNRASNLRWVSQSQNLHNRRQSTSESGVVGVCFRKEKRNPWQAYINVAGKFKSLGHFPTKELATQARQTAVLEVFNDAA